MFDEYVVMPYSKYIELITPKVNVTMIDSNDLTFINAVIQQLNPNNKYDCGIIIYNGNVSICLYKEKGVVLKSSFDISLCKRYYNHVSKFIAEVL